MERHTFDSEYLRRLAEGDQETERHFTEYFGELITIKLRSRLRVPHLVEDAKQEVFLRVLSTIRRPGGLDNPESLGAFVNSVSNNVLFEMYRSQSKFLQQEEFQADIPGEDPDAESVLVTEERRAKVRETLSSMTPKDRELLRWIFFEERDKDEVCRELGVDREYLRVLLHRAKGRFRTQFSLNQKVAGVSD